MDFGTKELDPEDDYSDFVVPMARAVASGKVTGGLAICESVVGAYIVADKVAGARAALIADYFSPIRGWRTII